MRAFDAGWPKISVITPSFNQAQFLEETIQSVFSQRYPNLEYFIIDGGSTDGSVDIIRRYADRLAGWISEADGGQAHAINKGLRMATGEWVGWQNSDDFYYPDAFESLARAARRHPRADLIIGDMQLVNARGGPIRDIRYVKPTHGALLAEGMVLTNQAAFWRRSVHADVGFLDENYDCGFDFDWFLRLTRARRSTHVNAIWGAWRLHDNAKASRRQEIFQSEYHRILHGRQPSPWMKRLYQVRRMALLLAQGRVSYVARGIWERTTGADRSHG